MTAMLIGYARSSTDTQDDLEPRHVWRNVVSGVPARRDYLADVAIIGLP